MHAPIFELVRTRTICLIACLAVLTACETPAPVTRPETPPSTLPEAVPPAGIVSPEVDEEFRGRYRARAKTEYAMTDGQLAPVEQFDDLEALKAFLRPQIDQIMHYHYQHLSEADTDATQRVAEERHNVSVVAYIHAVKHESGSGGDNDFHVMLGSSPTPDTGLFLTAEASGLPPDGPHRVLLAIARQELLSIVGPCYCGSRFMRVSPPLRVRVTGSLFFDGAHSIGAVGPQYAKPFTVWEIHPILSIDQLNDGASEKDSPVATDSDALSSTESQQQPAALPDSTDPSTPAHAPTARCNDGTMSFAKSHSGACSRHGGVAEWLQ